MIRIEEIILKTIKPLEFEDRDGTRIYKAIEPNVEPISEEIFDEIINENINNMLRK